MANVSHNTLTGVDLHYSKIQVSSGPPLTTPTFIGQSIWDSTNKVLYVAKGTASSADWQSQIISNLSIQSGTTYTVLTTDNGNTIVLTNVAARTITLPTAPVNGFSVSLSDGAGTSYSAHITVNSGGSDIFFDGTTSFVIDSNTSSYTLNYATSNTTWYLT